MLIILSGGIGLFMLAGMGIELWTMWSRPNPGFFALCIMAFMGLVFAGPCLVIAASLLRREDPDAVELMALMIAVASFFVGGSLVDLLGVRKWFASGDVHSWGTVKTAAAFVLSLLPFIVPVPVYRLCRKLGSRYLLDRPTPSAMRRTA